MGIDEKLIEKDRRWDVGQIHISTKGPDFIIVGKKGKELQMAQDEYDEKGERKIVIKSYSPANIHLTQSGRCIKKAISTNEIAKITLDELYGRIKPINELNKKYIEILKGIKWKLNRKNQKFLGIHFRRRKKDEN